MKHSKNTIISEHAGSTIERTRPAGRDETWIQLSHPMAGGMSYWAMPEVIFAHLAKDYLAFRDRELRESQERPT